MIVAVDFDGTLQMPNGQANLPLFEMLRSCQQKGGSVILWTCRSGKSLMEAVRFCAEHGLRFDCVNENTKQAVCALGSNPRKIYADLYIDDKAMRV